MNPQKIQWHNLPAEELLTTLSADAEQGLTDHEVQQRLTSYGPNRLTARRGISPIRLFFSQFNQPLVYILLVAAGVTAFLEEWVDSSVIFGVVLVNAIIGFIQEANALKAINALALVLNVSTTVIRDGQRRTILASGLVPGDLVILQSGDKVPADLRLLKVRELQIDESALTGESVSTQKRPDRVADATVLADRTNMAYSSTLVTYGTGAGVVVETGDRTEIGLINKMIGSATELETPLTQKMSQFSQLLLWVIIGMALLTFAVGVWRGQSMLDMFMASVALAVGAIPEGLPAALTITLAIGVSRMAKRNAIIRKLPAVETLGSTTVICSDKTGTLTQNQMTVQAIYAGDKYFKLSGSGYTPEGDFSCNGESIDPANYPVLMECLKAGLLCNDARLLADNDNWRIEGDPTEAALLVVAHKAGLHHDSVNGNHPRLDAIPFESQHQFMATLHHNLAQDARHIYLKGSLESLLARCDSAFDAQMNLIELNKDQLHQQLADMAAQGLRVLAFARCDHCADAVQHEQVVGGLTFLGLQAMIDPPRPEAAASIAACYRAGIQVKMITGDHPITALAIARQLGMKHTERVISGAELQAIPEEQLPESIAQCAVFARIAPEQKLQLVQALQANGHVVAMTGDGVNDAPALRQANIGVAMGQGGTEVAKEAAAMILTDDHFATIEAAVEEGRGVFDNLVKFIVWTLPTNLGEGLVITAAVFANVALPITPVQILWINMTTAVLLGLMLAFEPKEPGLMHRKPRDPKQPILTRHLVFRICLVGVLMLTAAFGMFSWELSHGESLAKARTVAANVFVFCELFYLFNCRSLNYSMFHIGVFSNLWVIFGVVSMTLLQLMFTYWPPMQALFGTAAIGVDEWLLIIAASIIIYATIGFEKLLVRRFRKK
ncbi:MAG: cation-transporting P-type ATPase [Methylococcaceae bacterium]|nr:cation-transporting P-type ATPase [Methylococcaceae bacterium]MDP2395334.1 cation-transporting P-type ATPase [Methylococcaceae bacterium]MDP3390122.1 cation-transporting P-type ATPase [Methylococcaceae bacterium]MDP3933973.1 cation-transporting P-type ATPase [Methylococcaceae bacterium]MDZ4155003.1 cation-transporting P-type ATPase [Methylococcales bacterium]